MIRTEVVELLAKIDLKNTKEKIKVICLSKYQDMQAIMRWTVKVSSLLSILISSIWPLCTWVYNHCHIDHNLIGNDGCYYLTKPKLQSLQTLDLTSNAITEDGSRFLAMGNWPHLRTLLICKYSITQPRTNSLQKAFSSWVKANGPTWSSSRPKLTLFKSLKTFKTPSSGQKLKDLPFSFDDIFLHHF